MFKATTLMNLSILRVVSQFGDELHELFGLFAARKTLDGSSVRLDGRVALLFPDLIVSKDEPIGVVGSPGARTCARFADSLFQTALVAPDTEERLFRRHGLEKFGGHDAFRTVLVAFVGDLEEDGTVVEDVRDAVGAHVGVIFHEFLHVIHFRSFRKQAARVVVHIPDEGEVLRLDTLLFGEAGNGLQQRAGVADAEAENPAGVGEEEARRPGVFREKQFGVVAVVDEADVRIIGTERLDVPRRDGRDTCRLSQDAVAVAEEMPAIADGNLAV